MSKKKVNKEQWPKVDIMLTWREREQLIGEPPELLQIYLLISSFRDFSTNISGDPYKISDRMFKDYLEITSTNGRKKKNCDTTKYRRMLKQLEKKGLIETRGKYVFYLPLAHIGKSGLKQTDTKLDTITDTKTDTKLNYKETQTQSGFEADQKTEVTPQLTPDLTPQPVYRSEEDLLKKTSEYLDPDLNNTVVNLEICDPVNIWPSKKKLTAVRFEEFWKIYPRKEKRKQALEIWKRKKLDRFADLIIADVKKRIETIEWVKGYVPHGTSYLNGERWNDQIGRNETNGLGTGTQGDDDDF